MGTCLCYYIKSKYDSSRSELIEINWKFGKLISLVFGVILSCNVILPVLKPLVGPNYTYGLIGMNEWSPGRFG